MAASWNLIASAGAVGAQGSTGGIGSTGPQGPQGPTGSGVFNAIGNPNFEVNQRSPVNVVNNKAWVVDRWVFQRNGAAVFQNIITSGAGVGTGYPIPRITSMNWQSVPQTAAAPAAGDYAILQQFIEGPWWSMMSQGPHSLQVVASCSVPNTTITIAMRDSNLTRALLLPMTFPDANPHVFQFPNLPQFQGTGGSFSAAVGSVGYTLSFCLTAGSSYIAPLSTPVWQTGNLIAVPAQSNWSNSTGQVLSIIFVQHEPGPTCSPLQQKPFSLNLMECQRYYSQSFAYGNQAGYAAYGGDIQMWYQTVATSAVCYFTARFPREMAKAPSITFYPENAGGNAGYINAASTGTLTAVSNSANVGTAGFLGLVLAATGTDAWAMYLGHWTADTGW